MTRFGLVAAAVLSACWSSRPPAPVLSNQTPGPATASWVLTERGLGALSGDAVATEEGLQRLLPRQRVVTSDLGGDSGVVFDVFAGSDRLAYVVPDDAAGWTRADGTPRVYAASMFAVFVVSSRVRVDKRDWRVGEPFTDDAGIDHCECWGGGEVTACFAKGSRVRVIFEQPCEAATRDGVRAMRGKKIGRIMWKRELEPPELLDN